jgi:5-methylcytosine-specific restriction endonuclease McrA
MSACGKCGRPVHHSPNRYVSKSKGECHRICPSRPKRRGEKKRRKLAIMSKKGWNLEATAARNFSDPRSRVMQDGREILYRLDWQARRLECIARDHGECRYFDGTLAKCDMQADDADHIIKRSKRRDDRLENLRSLCRFHHNLRHPEFRTRFGEARERSAP